jgi:alpha-tubulin suppressor-like RCC1 family protein
MFLVVIMTDNWAYLASSIEIDDNKTRYIPTLIQFKNNIKMIGCGQNHSIIVSHNDLLNRDDLYTFGSNYYGQLGLSR